MSFDFDTPVERRARIAVSGRGSARTFCPCGWRTWIFARRSRSSTRWRRAQQGVFGYGMDSKALKETLVERMQRLYGWTIEPEAIVMLPGLVSGLNIVSQAVGAPATAC